DTRGRRLIGLPGWRRGDVRDVEALAAHQTKGQPRRTPRSVTSDSRPARPTPLCWPVDAALPPPNRVPESCSGRRVGPVHFRYRQRPFRGALGWRGDYNALNSSAVLAYNTAFVPGGSWPQPLSILTLRFVPLTANVEF